MRQAARDRLVTIERPVALKELSEFFPTRAAQRSKPSTMCRAAGKTERYGAGVYASGPGMVVDGLTVTGADKVGACITVEGETE